MNFQLRNPYIHEQIKIIDHLPMIGEEKIRESIMEGLNSSPKRISSMFFYDSKGSKLFEDITELEEYYPTRIEKKLIKEAAKELAPNLGNTNIVELGSGDCSKIELLINEIPDQLMKSIKYTPIDVSEPAINESATKLFKRFPQLSIHGIVADFTSQFHLIPNNGRKLLCFFGSTLGNFDQNESEKFFRDIDLNLKQGDRFLLGVDMIKDHNIMENAYNDCKSVTAAFNRNILNVVNSLAGTDFNSKSFDHFAYYNQKMSRIEMHLIANQDMEIHCSKLTKRIQIKKGERIHTENSYKFTLEQIRLQAEMSNLKILKIYNDENSWFSLISMIKE